MSSVDRFSGDYYLTSINGNIHITPNNGLGTAFIFGNLSVIGKQTNIGSIDTIVTDNIITLAANVTGNPILNAGIEVKRGDEPTVSLIWNEEIDKWQFTTDGSFFSNIMIRVEDDPDPHLGGNLWTNGYEIRSVIGENIRLNPGLGESAIEIKNSLGNNVELRFKDAKEGDTGIYVSNDKKQDQELITKNKAIVYSLVL